MRDVMNFLLSNIYLYASIIVFLLIISIILTIIASNRNKRKQIKEDFVKAEIESNNTEEEKPVSEELEKLINQMKQDMEVRPEEVVARFEQEQEEKAIISYQELVDSVKKGKIQTIDDEQSDIDFVQALQDEINEEPINTIEVKENESSVTPEQLRAVINEIEKNKVVKEKPKFKTTEFISPVFGTQKMDITYPTVNTNRNTSISIDKTVDLDELTEEIKKSEAFLQALIEFRNNL